MPYMFAAVSAPAAGGGSGMSGMGGSSGTAMQTLSYPTLTFVFALILIGYTIWDLDQLSVSPAQCHRGRCRGPRPAMAGAEGSAAAFAASAAETGASADQRPLAGTGQTAAGGGAAACCSALEETRSRRA